MSEKNIIRFRIASLVISVVSLITFPIFTYNYYTLQENYDRKCRECNELESELSSFKERCEELELSVSDLESDLEKLKYPNKRNIRVTNYYNSDYPSNSILPPSSTERPKNDKPSIMLKW